MKYIIQREIKKNRLNYYIIKVKNLNINKQK